MLLIAADELDINLKQSWMVGNSYRDIAAGVRAGCKTILIKSSLKPATKTLGDPIPDKEAINIKEVVNIIKMYDRKIYAPLKNEPKLFIANSSAGDRDENTRCADQLFRR